MRFGCIADDFTGASDAASFLVKGGMRTLLLSGIPDEDRKTEDYDAVVIALKTRTQERSGAVEESLRAARWLREKGAGQIYIKYCSTFDSTPEGNIGPILDAVLEEFHVPYTILCPALPVNGRIVREGNLYVNGVPLHKSPMKDHPLTPMWDSDLARLMEAQSRYRCLKIGCPKGGLLERTRDMIRQFGEEKEHFYVIPDHCSEKDGEQIARMFAELPILSGGSGLLEHLADFWRKGREEQAGTGKEGRSCRTKGPALLLAGSCSLATRNQIAYAKSKGIPAMKMDLRKMAAGEQREEGLWGFIRGRENALVYSSESPGEIGIISAEEKEAASKLLESATARLAKRAVEEGYTRIVVAGGETSGAVTKALGYDSYEISESVAPGVPVMIPVQNPSVRLVLKSGNFGQEDFFLRALGMTGERKAEEQV